MCFFKVFDVFGRVFPARPADVFDDVAQVKTEIPCFDDFDGFVGAAVAAVVLRMVNRLGAGSALLCLPEINGAYDGLLFSLSIASSMTCFTICLVFLTSFTFFFAGGLIAAGAVCKTGLCTHFAGMPE